MAKAVLQQGSTLKGAAAAFNVSARTAAKWVARYRGQGAARLYDRSSRPHRLRGIFYYETADARERRAAKAIDDALRVAKRNARHDTR